MRVKPKLIVIAVLTFLLVMAATKNAALIELIQSMPHVTSNHNQGSSILFAHDYGRREYRGTGRRGIMG